MKLFMMPHTVPNSPTKGAVAPTVARMPVPRIMARPLAASIRSRREAMRSLTPARASPESRSSSSAARTSAPALSARPSMAPAASSQLRAWPSAAIAARKLRRALISSIALANQMVQVSSDAKTKPTITALTTISAAMNMPQGDRSRGNSNSDCRRRAGCGAWALASAGAKHQGGEQRGWNEADTRRHAAASSNCGLCRS